MRLLRKGLEFIFQAERNLFIYVEGFKKCVIHLSCLTKGLEEEHTIQTTNKSEKNFNIGENEEANEEVVNETCRIYS